MTVESALGEFTAEGSRFLAVDLPGTYSLAPRSPDELIAVHVLLGRSAGGTAPDVVLYVLDATNLDRNLYLLTQVIDVGRPVVVALTMTDLARKQGIVIDVAELEKRLGVPVVPVQPHRRVGLAALRRALGQAARHAPHLVQSIRFPEIFTREVDTLIQTLPYTNGQSSLPRFLVERLLIDSRCSLVGQAARVGEAQNVTAPHLVVQRIEPIVGRSLRFGMQRLPQLLNLEWRC